MFSAEHYLDRTTGASGSEVGAVYMAGAKRDGGTPQCSGASAERNGGQPATARVRACGPLPYLRVGNAFGCNERLITCGEF